MDIYQGDFFGSFLLGLDAFDSWLAATRDQLRLKATGLFETQISYHNSECRHADALIAAEHLVRLNPANEASQRLFNSTDRSAPRKDCRHRICFFLQRTDEDPLRCETGS